MSVSSIGAIALGAVLGILGLALGDVEANSAGIRFLVITSVLLVLGIFMVVLLRKVQTLQVNMRNAHQDSLTGLPDRFVATQVLDRIRRRHEHVTVAVVDVNGLKNVNDAFGHLAGDELIVAAATKLASVVLYCPGMVSRIGGDEFLVIVTDGPIRLTDALEQFSDSTLAIGIAECHDGRLIDETLVCADRAMYASKVESVPYCMYDEVKMGRVERRKGHGRRRTDRPIDQIARGDSLV
jgi:GGDEF domain-containing protein